MTDFPENSDVEERAHLLPEELKARSDDPQEQARVILEESEARTEHPDETKDASVQTPDDR